MAVIMQCVSGRAWSFEDEATAAIVTGKSEDTIANISWQKEGRYRVRSRT